MLGSSFGLSLRAWTLRLGGEKGTSWKEQRTIICRSGRCGGDRRRDRRGEDFDQVSRAPPCGTRSRRLVLGLRCDAGSGGLRGASHSHGTKPCLPLMCLGPLGIGRPTAGSPRRGCSHWAPHQSATSCIEPVPLPLSMAFKHGLHFLPPSLCVSCRRSSSRWVTRVQA